MTKPIRKIEAAMSFDSEEGARSERRPIDRTRGAPLKKTSGTYRTPIRAVVAKPHPVLAARAMEVDPCDPSIVALAHSLVATMRVSPACTGLAATQVGEGVRVFCADVTGHKKTRSCAGLVVMVNPRIVERSGEVTMREGCMSVPHLTGNVARAEAIVIEGLVPGSGRELRVTADAFEARCLQHELDHLDGFLFVDRVGNPDKDLFARKSYAPKSPEEVRRELLERIDVALLEPGALTGEAPGALELQGLAMELEEGNVSSYGLFAAKAESLIAGLSAARRR
jgi:peptide deformylase